MKLGSLITHQTSCQNKSLPCELNGQLLQYFLQNEFLNGKAQEDNGSPLNSSAVEDVRQKLEEKHTNLNLETQKSSEQNEQNKDEANQEVADDKKASIMTMSIR